MGQLADQVLYRDSTVVQTPTPRARAVVQTHFSPFRRSLLLIEANILFSDQSLRSTNYKQNIQKVLS